MIKKLQTEIIEFKISWIIIFIFSQNNNTNLLFVLKFEKFSDLLIFNNDWKNLYLFIIKLYLKFERNADWFLTDINKISYKIL